MLISHIRKHSAPKKSWRGWVTKAVEQRERETHLRMYFGELYSSCCFHQAGSATSVPVETLQPNPRLKKEKNRKREEREKEKKIKREKEKRENHPYQLNLSNPTHVSSPLHGFWLRLNMAQALETVEHEVIKSRFHNSFLGAYSRDQIVHIIIGLGGYCPT